MFRCSRPERKTKQGRIEVSSYLINIWLKLFFLDLFLDISGKSKQLSSLTYSTHTKNKHWKQVLEIRQHENRRLGLLCFCKEASMNGGESWTIMKRRIKGIFMVAVGCRTVGNPSLSCADFNADLHYNRWWALSASRAGVSSPGEHNKLAPCK